MTTKENRVRTPEHMLMNRKGTSTNRSWCLSKLSLDLSLLVPIVCPQRARKPTKWILPEDPKLAILINMDINRWWLTYIQRWPTGKLSNAASRSQANAGGGGRGLNSHDFSYASWLVIIVLPRLGICLWPCLCMHDTLAFFLCAPALYLSWDPLPPVTMVCMQSSEST